MITTVDNKLCLLIETTSPKGGLGLYFLNSKSNKLNSIQQWEGSSHSRFITSAFKSFNKSISDVQKKLSYIVVGVGPGRFTGIRVGVSFAKTISYILNIPIYPISSLKILAESQREQKKPILVLVNAFKNSLYMAYYQNKGGKQIEIISPTVILPQNLNKIILQDCVCVGDGYKVYESSWSDEFKKKIHCKQNIFPEVKDIPSLLNREFKPVDLISWEHLKPVYLRSPVRVIK